LISEIFEMQKETQTKQDEARTLISLDSGIGGMPFGRDELLTKNEADAKLSALAWFRKAYEAQMCNELDEAVELYKKSIDAYPTAEAHTFLGWTYSFKGLTDEAMEECFEAIKVDPDFGNPYNDIGAYLIEQGNLHAAVEWLERAISAPRYECYFYPHYNLGRIYEKLGRNREALREYKEAVDLNPGYAIALRDFRRLQGKFN